MEDILFWVYLANAVLLIVHEIGSAYWKEWDLFRLPGGIPMPPSRRSDASFSICSGLTGRGGRR